MNPLAWFYRLDLATFIPALVIALILTLTPWVRSRMHAPAFPRDVQRARPDHLVSLTISLAALVAVLVALGIVAEPALPSTSGPPALDFRWYEFTRMLLFACLTLATITAILTFARRTPRAAVPPAGPRGWRTFASRRGLISLSATFIALLLVTAFAGSISSPDEDGRYTMLVIDSGGTFWAGSGRFYGWAYGIPTTIVAALLVALMAYTLQTNATRPFLEPSTVAAEEASRRALATRILWFTTGALVYTLGTCSRRVGLGAAGELSTPEYSWGTSIASLGPVLTWGGGALQTAGIALFFLVAFTHRR